MTPLLYNPPIAVGPWLTWGAVHQSDHFAIVNGILNKKGISIGVLPIDPVPLGNRAAMLAWFMNHQAVHNQMNAAMGLGGFDLSYVDFTNEEQARVWIQYNALEHAQISAAIAAYQPPPPPQGQQSQAIMPQPFGVQPAPQPSGNVALLPQGIPGVQTIQTQPAAGTQIAPQGGQPQPALQPFATLQPQPSPAPQPGSNPGTPLQAGGGLVP